MNTIIKCMTNGKKLQKTPIGKIIPQIATVPARMLYIEFPRETK